MKMDYCYKRGDEYIVFDCQIGFHYGPDHPRYPVIEAYLLTHPEALIPEPVPPEPTAEELRQIEITENLAYLSSTDWYAVRLAETNTPIPTNILTSRQSARDRISELRP